MTPDLVPTLSSATAEDVAGSTNDYCLGRDGHVNDAGDAVVVALFRSGPAVLLIKRAVPPFTGLWALPGGMQDVGEVLGRTVERELMEEVGIDAAAATAVVPLGEVDSTSWDPRFVAAHVSATAFVVDPATEFTAGDDAASAAWVPVSDLAAGREVLAFEHALWLQRTFEAHSPLHDPALARSFALLAQAARVRNYALIEQVNAIRGTQGAREIPLDMSAMRRDRFVVDRYLAQCPAPASRVRVPRAHAPVAPTSPTR